MSATSTQKTAFVFGSGPAALLAALYFQNRMDYQVTLFDSGASFDRINPRLPTAELPFWPGTERTEELLTLLQDTLGVPMNWQRSERTPVLASAEKLSDFVGFGDKNYRSIPAVSVFNSRSQYDLNMPNTAILEAAFKAFTGEIQSYANITSIQFDAQNVSSVQINGSKDMTADQYVFTQSPAELLELFPEEVLSSRMRSKIARTAFFSRITLKTDGFPAGERLNMLSQSTLFLIPQAADFEPSVGQVSEQSTLWNSFLDSESAEDAEKVAGQVRHMRKTIERAFPELAKGLKAASISFDKEAFAEYDSATIVGNLQKTNENMLLTSPLWSSLPGLAGALDALDTALKLAKASMVDRASGSEGYRPTSLESTI